MSFGYVEELALRYFDKINYLTVPNIRFQLKKEWTGKKIQGWSDIDLLAINQNEIIIVQCKTFIGTKKSEIISEEIISWFNYVVKYITCDEKWSTWANKRNIKKYLIVDSTVKCTEDNLKKNDIVIISYEKILIDLINLLKDGKSRKGKEDDIIIRLLCSLIDKHLLNPTIIKNFNAIST